MVNPQLEKTLIEDVMDTTRPGWRVRTFSVCNQIADALARVVSYVERQVDGGEALAGESFGSVGVGLRNAWLISVTNSSSVRSP
jgi:hypothetical protein